jgi:hypothetical protein
MSEEGTGVNICKLIQKMHVSCPIPTGKVDNCHQLTTVQTSSAALSSQIQVPRCRLKPALV